MVRETRGDGVHVQAVGTDGELVSAFEVLQVPLAVEELLDEREAAGGGQPEGADGVVALEPSGNNVDEPAVGADGNTDGTGKAVGVPFVVLDDLADARPAGLLIAIGDDEGAGPRSGDEEGLVVGVKGKPAAPR